MAAKSVHRVLITGASGLLGRALMNQFNSSNAWQVLGLAYSRVSGNLRKANLLDFNETRQIIEDFNPHFVIHSAAERRPDFVDKDLVAAKNLNVGSTEFLAQLIEGLNKGLETPQHFLLYISTDYVFDGNNVNAPYKPDDVPNPLNKYGESKLEGEVAVKAAHPNGLILRVPVLYGDVENLQESSVTGLLKVIQETSHPASIDDYHLRYPTLVDDVSGICQFLANTKLQDPTLTGTFHWSGDEQMTKYAMLCRMAEVFHLPITHVTANQTPPAAAQRPFNSALECGRLEEMMGSKKHDYRTPFKKGVKKYLQKYC